MHLNFKSKLTQLLAIAFMAGIFTSCDDDNDFEINYGSGNYGITMAYAPSDGSYNYTYRTVRYESLMDGTLNNINKGTEQLGYFSYTQINDMIFSPGGLELETLETIEDVSNDELRLRTNSYSFNASIVDFVKAGTNTAVAVEMSSSSTVVRLHLINTNDASVTSTTETNSSLLSPYTGPAYSGMAVSGNYVFLSYYVSNPTSFATDYIDKAEIAVFSYPELEFIKVISDDRTGPIGGFNTLSGLMKDDNGDIYAVSHTNKANGYSQFNENAGILRIKSGESEFDTDYFFDFNADGDGNTTAHLMFLGNNKVLALMNTQNRAEQASWSDAPLKPAILDLSAKTINYINDIPEFSGSGRKLTAIAFQEDNYIYLPVGEDDGIYIYRINSNDYSATKGALLECNFVAGMYKF